MPKNKRKNLKKPRISLLILDFVLIIGIFFLIIGLFPFQAQHPFEKYLVPFFVFLPIWFFFGISFQKYHSFRWNGLQKKIKSLLASDLSAIFISFILILIFPTLNLSTSLLLLLAGIVISLEILVLITYYSFRYATNYEPGEAIGLQQVKEKQVLKKDELLDEETQKDIRKLISKTVGKRALDKLSAKLKIGWKNTFVLHTTSIFNIQNLKANRFSTIVNLKRVNDVRGINDLFIATHEKLPFHGLYAGCFYSKSTYKKIFLQRYPFGLNYFLYAINFTVKRIVPKLKITREIYFWVTGGKNRILSKAEVYGRLYCCGFEIVDEFQADHRTFFIARKVKEPNRSEVKTYGPIIKLRRVGKNGKVFSVYKFRTMHPFSEYLQPYIFEKNHLREGGKIAHDIRINSVGAFMRKYWLDELPMFVNFFKGDMKLVGVRPISKHYFSLYSSELQEKRTKHRPGLLPPFYADMPKTLPEIEASEMKYLTTCEKKGTFITDIRYLWMIFYNIVFKKARSK